MTAMSRSVSPKTNIREFERINQCLTNLNKEENEKSIFTIVLCIGTLHNDALTG